MSIKNKFMYIVKGHRNS